MRGQGAQCQVSSAVHVACRMRLQAASPRGRESSPRCDPPCQYNRLVTRSQACSSATLRRACRYKYVDQTHQGVATEWETVQLTSAYNAFVDADACCIANMANAALFASYPLADRYVQRSPPSQQALIDAGYMTATGSVVGSRLYYMNYFGDFDSAVSGGCVRRGHSVWCGWRATDRCCCWLPLVDAIAGVAVLANAALLVGPCTRVYPPGMGRRSRAGAAVSAIV